MTTRVLSPIAEKPWSVEQRCLASQAIERLPQVQAGDLIACTQGILWVTQAGDPEDYLLRKGSAFVASRPGLVLVQALTPAAYRYSPLPGRQR